MLIEIFVAPEGCPSCGKADRAVRQVASHYPGVEVSVIHITDAPDRVVEYGVYSTPFVVINGTVRHVGVPSESTIRKWIEAPSPDIS